MIKVGVHELLHGLNGETALSALLVILYLLVLHVCDDVLELLQWKHLVGKIGDGLSDGVLLGTNNRGLLGMDRLGVVLLHRLRRGPRWVQIGLRLLCAALVELSLISKRGLTVLACICYLIAQGLSLLKALHPLACTKGGAHGLEYLATSCDALSGLLLGVSNQSVEQSLVFLF